VFVALGMRRVLAVRLFEVYNERAAFLDFMTPLGSSPAESKRTHTNIYARAQIYKYNIINFFRVTALLLNGAV